MRLSGARGRQWTLPLVLGFSDGIFNALTLASGAVLKGAHRVTLGLGFKVGCVACISAIFSMFIAQYAETRARLSRSTQQLNLSPLGRLAATHLGRRATLESAQGALVASVSSLVGAMLPLLIAASFRSAPWTGLAIAVVLLGTLGTGLAAAVGGSRLRWASGLTLSGVIVGLIGARLNIA